VNIEQRGGGESRLLDGYFSEALVSRSRST
jgi:hypothetical protein